MRRGVALVLGLLAGAVALAAEPLPLQSTFSADEIAFVNQPGKSSVSGGAVLRLADGTLRNCAGFNVELLPVAAYSSERILRTYGNTRQGQILLEQNPPKFTPDVKEYHQMLLKSVCDAEGVFRFEHVPAGEYFIMAFLIQDGKGGALMKRVRIGVEDNVSFALGVLSQDPGDDSVASAEAAYPALAWITDGDATLAYQPAGARVIKQPRALLPKQHPLHLVGDLPQDDVVLLETTLRGAGKVWVVFTQGASFDPAFYMVREAEPTRRWAEVDATVLAIPGDDTVFTATRANSHFTRRQQYRLTSAGLKLLRQPYFAVDLDTVALKPLALYATPAGNDLVTTLPPGAPLRVVLTDDQPDAHGRRCFLVKTPGGLLGWAWVKSTQYPAEDIAGISFWGD